MSSGRTSRAVGLIAALGTGGLGSLVGCTDSTALSPPAEVSSRPWKIADADADALRSALADARTRLLPGLASDAARAGMSAGVDSLVAALDARNAARAQAALVTLQAVPQASDAADDPELAAIHLVLDRASALLRAQ
jgi:hypothetical protein